jgi:hypothetical protein
MFGESWQIFVEKSLLSDSQRFYGMASVASAR